MATQPKKPNRLRISRRHPQEEPQDFFYCSYPDCNYKNNWEENVGRHEQSHNPTGYWNIPCQVCPQVFGFLVGFFYHMSSQHSNKLFCPWCLFFGRDWDDFKAHMLAHISTPGESCLQTAKTTGQFSCGTYSKNFTSTRDLIPHVKYSCAPNSFSSASTTIQVDNRNRSQASSDVQPEESEFESITAPNEVGQILKRSLTTSSFCGSCSKTFTTKSNLARHQKKHCNSSNSAAVQNQNYLTKAIKEPKALLGCDKCSYKTSRKDNLRTHSRIHLSVKPFKCPNLGCAYKTHLPQSLQSHQRLCQGRIHTAAETWGEISIASVGKVKREGRPEISMKKVNEEQARYYSCSVCSFRSNRKHSLNSHLRVHFGQKFFSCPIQGCMYRSKWLHNLSRHSRLVHEIAVLKAILQTKETSGSEKECQNETKVTVRSSSSMAFACMLCDFIGDSELSALKHSCQHRTVVISLNRI